MSFVRPPLHAALAALFFTHLSVAIAAEPSAAEMRSLRQEEMKRVHIYKAYFPDPATARKAAITFHANLLEAAYEKGFLVLELDELEIATLRSHGFRVETAPEYVQLRDDFLNQVQQAADARSSSGATTGLVGVQSIPGYACYETVEETFAAAEGFATTYPNLAQWIDVGDSWQKTNGQGGYDIRVLKLTNRSVTGTKPRLFINSAIHAREYTTAPLTLELARWLVNGYGTNPDATWILDHHEVHLMLQTNPDGRKKAEGGLSWRKNTNTNYCGPNSNSRGADLNRNFTFSWNSTGGQGSSGSACNETYRGPSPGSEPEVKAVEAYIRSIFPDRRGPNPGDAAPADTSGMHIDIHSYSQLVLWPWGSTATPTGNAKALQTLGRRLAYFNNYTPQQSIGLYPTDGTSDGPSYGELGVAAYTIELGTSFFESCTSYNGTTKPRNLPALIYAAKVVRAPYQIPGGPEVTTVTLSGDASGGGVPANTPVGLTAAVTHTRFNQSNGTEPTLVVTGAEAYIDTPPWVAGAQPIPLSAADGSFNATTETVTATLSTAGLSAGKHLVYVRAKVSSGQWGPFTAQFLNVGTSLPPGNTEVEPNDLLGTATPVPLPGTWNGTAGARGDNDYYRLTLPAGASLTATLSPNAASDYDLFVYTADGAELGRSDRGTGAVDSVTLSNTTGASVQRLVRVKFYSGGFGATDGKYTLSLNW